MTNHHLTLLSWEAGLDNNFLKCLNWVNDWVICDRDSWWKQHPDTFWAKLLETENIYLSSSPAISHIWPTSLVGKTVCNITFLLHFRVRAVLGSPAELQQTCGEQVIWLATTYVMFSAFLSVGCWMTLIFLPCFVLRHFKTPQEELCQFNYDIKTPNKWITKAIHLFKKLTL